MIASVRAKNFKCYESLYFNLRNKRSSIKDQVFIFGDSATGKSSIISLFSFLMRSTTAMVYDQMKKERTGFDYQPFILRDEIREHARIGAVLPTTLEYEFEIKNKVYYYEIRFYKHRILYESLFVSQRKQDEYIFKLSGHRLNLNENYFKPEAVKYIMTHSKDVEQKYSFLAYLYALEKEKKIKLYFNKTNAILNDFISSFHVSSENFNHHNYYRYALGEDFNFSGGTVSPKMFRILMAAQPAINTIMKDLFPYTDHFEIEVTKRDKDWITYETKIYKNYDGKIINIPYYLVPTSIRTVFQSLNIMVHAYFGKTVIVDDFADAISPFLFKKIYHEYLSKAKSQVILSKNSGHIISDLEPSQIYITHFDKHKHVIHCVDEIESVQKNHNVLKRYLEGRYGEMERNYSSELNQVLDELNKNLDPKITKDFR